MRTFALAAKNENKTRFAAESVDLKQKRQPSCRRASVACRKGSMR